MLIVGTGCVAQGFLPLLLRHVDIHPRQITILGPDADGDQLARAYGVTFQRRALTRENFPDLLSAQLSAGDCLLNLALGVGSLDLLAWCQSQRVLYLDTNLEPWSNSTHRLYEARSTALRDRRPGTCTAVIAHGANPGLVSHFLKQALWDLASADTCSRQATFARGGWAGLAGELGIRVIQVAERDSHTSHIPRGANEFANTWSARGLASELRHPAELGWGSHETRMPSAARGVETDGGRVIVFEQPAGSCMVRSWTPCAGALDGYLVGHHEAISMSEMLTPADGHQRPTVFYAYQPCLDARRSAQELRERGWIPQTKMRVMKDELKDGGNELGVLLLGIGAGHWFGSRLSLAQARELAPGNNATSLQVAAGVLGGLVWALEHPNAGVVEAEDMDFQRVLAVASPYLGVLGGIHTDWRPVSDTPREAALRFGHFLVEPNSLAGGLPENSLVVAGCPG
jgi:homospermidine synthase